MATIITRSVGTTAKNSPLTNTELDNNFININTQVIRQATNSCVPDCINSLGTIIPKGTIVMTVGSSNDALRIAPAINNGTFQDDKLLGILQEDAQANATNAKVLIYGTVIDTNTSAWAAGTILYSDPVTSGALTSVKPAVPASSDSFAEVLTSAAAGVLFVRKQASKVDKTIGREVNYIMSPTVDDDINSGYRVWDKWLNTSTSTFYICAGNTAGAADWVAIN